MTSPARVLAVLELFTRDRPVWTPDEINEALGYARATGYRYVKELLKAGFLQKVSVGRYALGGHIIELDYRLRESDPILLAAIPTMEAVAAKTGFDVVLSVLFEGPKVIDTHRVKGREALEINFGRGRPRPVFRSGAPKILISGLARHVLVRLYETHASEIASAGLGRTWSEFRANLAEVRKQGFYLSYGELRPGMGAAVAPVCNAEGEVVAALSLVGTEARLRQKSEQQLRKWVQEAAAEVQERLAASVDNPHVAAR